MSRHITRPDRAENAVSQWNREIPGLNLLPMKVLGRLFEVSQVVMKEKLEPIFAIHGLKPGEFDVLATLRRSGAPYALTPTQLYNASMVSSGGMTARLDRLQKTGLINRKPHKTDRRALMACLTVKGQTVIENILPVYITAQTEALAGLTQAEQELLAGLLERLLWQLSNSDVST